MKRDLPDAEERLREWGRCFRDKHRWQRCASIENRFMPGSADYVKEDWGNPERTPTAAPQDRNWILRACATQDAMTRLSKAPDGRVHVWAMTYYYAYPHLPKGMVLRIMFKYTHKRIGWEAFMRLVWEGVDRIEVML